MPTKKVKPANKRPPPIPKFDAAATSQFMIKQFQETWSGFSLKSRAEIELVLAAGAVIGQFMVAAYTALVQLKKGKMPSVTLNADLLTDAACTYADLRPRATRSAKSKKRKTAKKRK